MKQLKPNSKYLLFGQALSFMGDYCVLPALLILPKHQDRGQAFYPLKAVNLGLACL